MSDVGDYNLIYDSEDFSVLSPRYIDSSDSVTGQEGIEGENEEISSDIESSDFDYSDYYNNIIDNQLLIQSQIDNLNSNVCTLNHNLVITCGLLCTIVIITVVKLGWYILNNLLGLGNA